MDSRTFLGLEPTADPLRWRMPITQGLCTGRNFLFGGAGLAAGIAALEAVSGRGCVWAAAQFLSFVEVGKTLDIDLVTPLQGHQVTQGRAVCSVAGREILTVNAALGERSFPLSGQWAQMPDVPRPDECRHRIRIDEPGSINSRIEQRLVRFVDWAHLDGSTPGDGSTQVWVRMPEIAGDLDATVLALLGDLMYLGVGQALGMRGGGSSLDNTLRVGRVVPTSWVLLEIEMHMAHRGFGHGSVKMFAEDGTLLSVATQSCALRFWEGAIERTVEPIHPPT